jgi:hypothetical protein
LAGSGEEERKGEGGRARRDSRRRWLGEAKGEEERKGTGVRLTGGVELSTKQKKRKGEAGGVGCRGEELVGRWAAGLERGRKVSFFFFFSFSNPFQTKFFKLKFK